MSEDGTARAAGSAALRAELLAGIRRRRTEFEAAGEQAEKLRTLPAQTVETLRAMGAFRLAVTFIRVVVLVRVSFLAVITEASGALDRRDRGGGRSSRVERA